MKPTTAAIMRHFGLTPCYCGYDALLYAVMRAAEDRTRLRNAALDIYAPVAMLLGTKPANIETNIRTMVQRAWQVDKEFLSEIAGYHLDGPPSATQFIEILANYVREKISEQEKN